MKIDLMILPAELAVGWLTMFLIGTELFVFSPLLPTLAVNYNVSSSMAGLCVTTFSLSYMIGAPLLGHVSDRVGKRRVLICCLAAFGTANLLTASATNFSWLLALRLFAGAAAAGISPSIYALVGDAAPPDRRATWLAFTVSGLLVSLALGASPAALVGATFGWAPVFIALGVFSLALAALNYWVWPRGLSYAGAEVPATRSSRSGVLDASFGAGDRMGYRALWRIYVSWRRTRRIRFFQIASCPSGHGLWLRGDRRYSDWRASGRSARGKIHGRGEPRRSFDLLLFAACGTPCRCLRRACRGIERSGGAVILSRSAIRSSQGLPRQTRRSTCLE